MKYFSHFWCSSQRALFSGAGHWVIWAEQTWWNFNLRMLHFLETSDDIVMFLFFLSVFLFSAVWWYPPTRQINCSSPWKPNQQVSIIMSPDRFLSTAHGPLLWQSQHYCKTITLANFRLTWKYCDLDFISLLLWKNWLLNSRCNKESVMPWVLGRKQITHNKLLHTKEDM